MSAQLPPMLDPLRYPVGRFEHEGPITQAHRDRWTDEIAALPERLLVALDGLTDAQLDTPYRPGGWSLREVAFHLADSHFHGYARVKWALTESRPTIKPYDENAWADLPDTALPVSIALETLAGLHARWAALLRALPPAAFDRTYLHPDDGEVSVGRAVGVYAWHGQHHLAHVTGLIEREGW